MKKVPIESRHIDNATNRLSNVDSKVFIMTPQEVFDTVVTHLRKQGERSVVLGSVKNSCQYRISRQDGTTLKCAAGCLITDDEYVGWMEGMSIAGVLNEKDTAPSLKERLGHHGSLISSLQHLHDERLVEDWENALSWIAEERGLIYTPPSNPNAM